MISIDDMDQTYVEFEDAFNSWRNKKIKNYINEFDKEKGNKEEGTKEE